MIDDSRKSENDDDETLPAGDLSAWLSGMLRALDGTEPAAVPCGGCTACCTSSQFVHIGPDEADALAHIPRQLLFPAPRMPAGHVLMGYDERGHCPMLVDGACSIYAHRPRTCRTYDCRVYSAAGLGAGDGRTMINARIAGWRFEFRDDRDHREFAAVQAAARYLRQHPVRFPNGRVPSRPAEIAVLAVKVHQVFLDPPSTDREIVSAIIQAVRDFGRHSTRNAAENNVTEPAGGQALGIR